MERNQFVLMNLINNCAGRQNPRDMNQWKNTLKNNIDIILSQINFYDSSIMIITINLFLVYFHNYTKIKKHIINELDESISIKYL